MVYRIYVEKKEGFDHEAKTLLADARNLLGLTGVERIRVINRYDAEDIEEELFYRCVKTVFSEPQTDTTTEGADLAGARVFAVEYLPGQFDGRADSAAQCIQLVSMGTRPVIRTAKVYAVYGNVREEDLSALKRYVINPAESREASLSKPRTLKIEYPVSTEVETLHGFIDYTKEELKTFAERYGLKMDADDIALCRDYFRSERRDPTVTEIRTIDAYWSDRCRNTAFRTTIDKVEFEDGLLANAYKEYLGARDEVGDKTPVNLMDVGTIACKLLKKRGLLGKIESEENDACTLKVKVTIDGNDEDWLLLFQNATNNYPTGIEPFGGAIRDSLSGRSYAYAAMRVTGAANPLRPVSEMANDKLSQREIATASAAGASCYGNQIGLATGQVDEIYHDGYAEKRLEMGAVIAAVPEENVRRVAPAVGDKVILIGGKTGRDGCGGALETRKLQRLLRNKRAMLLVKRCNGLGAGGVAVAIGKLADGVKINLNAVPQKHDGLDGTELALSISQERMAVVVEANKADEFIALAARENLQATVIAEVTANSRLVMTWNGKTIVDISREFLHLGGAEKHIDIAPAPIQNYKQTEYPAFANGMRSLACGLNICSKRGLAERFDSTIGAGTVLMPFGGKYQQTPAQAMVHLVSAEKGHTDTVSFMAWGGNPYIAEKSPYHSAYLAVVESVSKLIATGASFQDVYLSFQENFLNPKRDPVRWGQPLSALLGAFKAQTELGVAAIGGNDCMSGSFENIDVPPTFLSFAVTTGKVRDVISPEFKGAGHKVVLLVPEYDEDGLPVTASLLRNFRTVTNLIRLRGALSVYTPGFGGVAEGVLKMCLGNGLGFRFSSSLSEEELFGYGYGSFIIELAGSDAIGVPLGTTTSERTITKGGEELSLGELQRLYENKLEPVYPCNIPAPKREAETFTSSLISPAVCNTPNAAPKVLIPVFPGTNGEYDAAKAFSDAGARPEIFVVRNRTQEDLLRSAEKLASRIKESQIVFIPGGFSGGDEPDGAAKFIAALLRGEQIKEEITALLEERDGLMGGIGNGFQALIKLGLLPYGKIEDTDGNCPTLTYNEIGRHQSRIVRVRVASVKSPWLSGVRTGDIFSVPVSHGEGKFVASDELIKKLAANGQIMTQYVDLAGRASMDVHFNPNGSVQAVEGILSPDGRVFGKMGHSERKGYGLYKNVPGNYDMRLFESAVRYFK
ncbi:MAG: phosphoribosylformylglycinamidine synthase subunit PurQ [Clostridia bacterium]|nr:phosphoribosylformylglycinamidine synthase subunit PurQ [Clostridia bacterium]